MLKGARSLRRLKKTPRRSNPENTALSGKLDAIHKAVSSLNIPESSNLELNIEQQAAVLKSSLESIKDTLHSMQNNNDANNAVTEKLVSLETAISEGIKQYDDNIISLNNKINEYISSILKLGEITDSKLDDSVTGLTELKFEIKGIVETINDISSKTNNKVDNAIDSFKLIDETLREKLEDITNTIRIIKGTLLTIFTIQPATLLKEGDEAIAPFLVTDNITPKGTPKIYEKSVAIKVI